MMKRLALTIVLASVLGTTLGCGNSGGQPETQAAAPVVAARSSLEELRTMPRAEIVKRADEVLADVRSKEEGRKKEKLTFELLPKWYKPLVLPLFQDQKYNAELGFSVPSYVSGKKPDQLSDLAG